jgi:hypothetical protein
MLASTLMQSAHSTHTPVRSSLFDRHPPAPSRRPAMAKFGVTLQDLVELVPTSSTPAELVSGCSPTTTPPHAQQEVCCGVGRLLVLVRWRLHTVAESASARRHINGAFSVPLPQVGLPNVAVYRACGSRWAPCCAYQHGCVGCVGARNENGKAVVVSRRKD